MSGRLVILPHKSWNVWNRDNREKVARDERVHREKQEEIERNNRYLLQEQQSQELLHNLKQSSQLSDDGSNVLDSNVPFRLFEDIEKQETEKILKGNPDYRKEQKEKELRELKREGVAPWAFGDGSIEAGAKRPWYLGTKSAAINETLASTSEIQRALGIHGKYSTDSLVTNRERDRILQDDPAIRFCNKDYLKKRVDESVEIGYAEHKIDDKEKLTPNINDDEPNLTKSNKRHHKKDKSKSHKSNRGDHKHHSSKTSDSNEAVSSANTRVRSSTVGNDDLIAQLRLKRLDRERTERKKSMALLVHADIYGPPTPVTTHGYHSQYHPILSRK